MKSHLYRRESRLSPSLRIHYLRPGCCQESWGHSITSSKSTSNHHTVKHGDEEDLRIEKRAKSVDESIPALPPVHLAMEESNVVAKGSGTALMANLVARNAI